jgi:hypothetical protein
MVCSPVATASTTSRVLRAGATASVLGHRVMAASTVGRSCGRSRLGMCASSTDSTRPR